MYEQDEITLNIQLTGTAEQVGKFLTAIDGNLPAGRKHCHDVSFVSIEQKHAGQQFRINFYQQDPRAKFAAMPPLKLAQIDVDIDLVSQTINQAKHQFVMTCEAAAPTTALTDAADAKGRTTQSTGSQTATSLFGLSSLMAHIRQFQAKQTEPARDLRIN